MDYGKLNKQELVRICEERKLSFSSSWTKEKLENALIDYDNKVEKTQNVTISDAKVNDNQLGKAGATINIVFNSIEIALTLMYTIGYIIVPAIIIGTQFLMFISILMLPILIIITLFLIPTICSLVSNVRYIKGKDNKIMAGVLGLLSASLIGSILVFCGKDNKDNKKLIKNK